MITEKTNTFIINEFLYFRWIWDIICSFFWEMLPSWSQGSFSHLCCFLHLEVYLYSSWEPKEIDLSQYAPYLFSFRLDWWFFIWVHCTLLLESYFIEKVDLVLLFVREGHFLTQKVLCWGWQAKIIKFYRKTIFFIWAIFQVIWFRVWEGPLILEELRLNNWGLYWFGKQWKVIVAIFPIFLKFTMTLFLVFLLTRSQWPEIVYVLLRLFLITILFVLVLLWYVRAIWWSFTFTQEEHFFIPICFIPWVVPWNWPLHGWCVQFSWFCWVIQWGCYFNARFFLSPIELTAVIMSFWL